ncbi:MAG TPA: serine hydrolase [Vicinamibacterales bacterium]|nr:serine hydrolase [Vicinamibacterales bacterium]
MTCARRSTALVLAIVLSAAVAAAQPAAPPGFDAFVGRVMKTFEVPGLSVAIVKDADTFVKGYGVRKLGEPAPVDAGTLFGIASNTKVFTAAALGLLVEEGKLQWDGRVIDYLPWFQMYDPYVTRELTIRDLLVHRSGLGLGAGDLLWWPPSTYDRKQIAARLRHIKPVAGFRTAYAYDNVLYLIAGEVIEAISGQSWEDFVGSRLLAKAGMKGSNLKHSDAALAGNVAATHARVEGIVRPITPFLSDNTNPAGGINSSAEDMAKWVRVLLAKGALPDGTRLFSEATWRQLTTLVTPVPIGSVPQELAAISPSFNGYALGLGVRDYRGEKLLTHTGGLPGYVSRVAWIPSRQLGVVVLTNQESSEAFQAIVHHVLDHHLGAKGTDWVETYRVLAGRQQGAFDEAEKKAMAARNPSSRPSLPLPKYAGRYRDEWYGDVTLTEENGRLVMRFVPTPSLAGTLEHFQYDTFIVRWNDRELRADAYVQFALKPDGSIDRVTMDAVSPMTDFSYDFQDLLLVPVPSGK